MALDSDFLHIAAIDSGHKFAKDNFRFAAVLLIKNAEYSENDQRQDQPKGDMFR
jgi:hypothetical protein